MTYKARMRWWLTLRLGHCWLIELMMPMSAVLKAQGIEPVIPSKSNRNESIDYDKELYKARHLIENFFAKLKQYRAIATRYDKTAVNFLGAVHLAAAVIWLN